MKMICAKKVQERNKPCSRSFDRYSSRSVDRYSEIDKTAEICYYNAVYSLLRGGVECTL